jgi:GAF domain/ANTAR domain
VTSIPVSGAAISASMSPTARSTMFATNGIAARMEDLQIDLGEGPGTDALRARGPVLISDLQDVASLAGRWPAFTPAALTEGARAVFAFPLILGAADIGLLGLYRDQPGSLDDDAHATAVRLADAAMFALIELSNPGEDLDAEASLDRLSNEDSDFFRAEVFQAIGMVTAQLGVSVEEAAARLRAFAYADDRAVADVARDVVARTLRFAPDSD